MMQMKMIEHFVKIHYTFDVHYIIKNDRIHTDLKEMKDFLFQLKIGVNLRNLLFSILFLLLIEMRFGFISQNVQLWLLSWQEETTISLC